MLLPKRVKHRRQFRGSMAGKATRGNKITTYDQPLSAGNYSICHLHEENNTLHEHLTVNSLKEVAV